MKIYKIIQKNFKLLLRSRTSAFIIVLGPLLIMLLVGISFNTFDTYNINIGVFTPHESEIVESFILILDKDSYTIKKYESSEKCISAIEVGDVHTCIIFPQDLRIENDRTNEIIFYVDQSKVNIVYLIRDILTSSIYNKSSQISTDLTTQIVDTLFDTRTGLTESSDNLRSILPKDNEIIVESEATKANLGNIDLNAEENPNVDLVTQSATNLGILFEEIRSEAKSIANDADDLIDDLEDYGSLDSNQTEILDNAKDEIGNATKKIDEIFFKSEDETQIISTTIQSVEDTISDMSSKLQTAKNTLNNDVFARIDLIQQKSKEIKQDIESLNQKINDLTLNIDSVKVTNTENIVSPITTKIENVLQSKSQLNFLFPSMVVMLIMFIGLLLPSLLIIMEKNSRAHFRIFTTPNRDRIFILTTFLTSFILISIQIILMILVSIYYFKITDIFNNYLILLLTLSLVVSFFVLVGMIIGYLFSTEEIATITSFSLGAILLLTSGLIFPVETMPKYVLDKIKYNPAVISLDLIRESLLFNFDFQAIKPNLNMILLYTLGVLILMFIINRIGKLKFLHYKPGKAQIKKQMLMEQFMIEGKCVKTIDELIHVLKSLPNEVFYKVVKENILKDWLKIVANNKLLAFRLLRKKTKSDILEVLEEYSLKKRNVNKKEKK